MTLVIRRMSAVAGAGALALLCGCSQPAPPPPPPQAGLPLVLPMLDVMRASVEIPADGLWELQSMEKPTAEDWALADQDAADLIAATSLITRPGTGKDDAARLANPDWQAWAMELQKAALAARAAAKAKNLEAFSTAADKISEVCLACHTKYRPEVPSDGVVRYPFYPKRVRDKSAG